jgi:hypothetical protein
MLKNQIILNFWKGIEDQMMFKGGYGKDSINKIPDQSGEGSHDTGKPWMLCFGY